MTIPVTPLRMAAASLLAALITAGAAQAATAIDLTTPGEEFDGATLTLGFAFKVSQDVMANGLGVYDSDKDGLLWDAPIGLWDMQGHLLASAVVAKGGTPPLEGLFRYADIDPVRLAAGQTYVVGAYLVGDFATSLGVGKGGVASVDPRIQIVADRFGNHRFGFPDLTEGNTGAWLGGDVRFADTVPEPAAWALMIAGFGLVGAALRRNPTLAHRA